MKVKAIDDLYIRLNHRGLSPATIQRYHALLDAAFQQAMAWGWLPTNAGPAGHSPHRCPGSPPYPHARGRGRHPA